MGKREEYILVFPSTCCENFLTISTAYVFLFEVSLVAIVKLLYV